MNGNWSRKEEMKKTAEFHTKEMSLKYVDAISVAIKNTKIYQDIVFEKSPFKDKYTNLPYKETDIRIESLDSVSAVFKETGKVCVLNFASYKNAGGMFISGSIAQEECLCHASFLYNVLKEQTEYYDYNNQHKNKALYTNRGLYSPDILFFQNQSSKVCDVITCAAPNKTAASKYMNVSEEENNRFLKDRICFVLDMALANNVETLILGDYGCGVFGQDAKEVALIFKEYLETGNGAFKKVVFAIPDGNDGNLAKFQKVFGNDRSD